MQGALYGSVSTRDVADLLAEAAVTVERRQIVIGQPIKILGIHTVTLNLHPEVDSEIRLNVARSVEEADLQASGKVRIQEQCARRGKRAAAKIRRSSELFALKSGSAGMDNDDYDHTRQRRQRRRPRAPEANVVCIHLTPARSLADVGFFVRGVSPGLLADFRDTSVFDSEHIDKVLRSRLGLKRDMRSTDSMQLQLNIFHTAEG